LPDLAVGMHLQGPGPGGRPTHMQVIELTDDKVKLDANHALAGKDLTFEIELVGIS